MRRFPALLVLALAAAALPLAAQSEEALRITDAVEVFTALAAAPERELTDVLLREAYAVAIIPHARRLGFIVGVQKGSGVLVARGANGQWGSPLFIQLSGGSVGWQVGVQSADLVLFFRTKKSVEAVLAGGFTMGVDAGVSAGALGRQAGAGTDADMQAEIYSWSRSRGLFAGVSLSGSTIAVDEAANAAFYGRGDLRPRDILGRTDIGSRPPALELRRALEKQAKAGER
jgi:lipid-binding SYLF domain-containing protein